MNHFGTFSHILYAALSLSLTVWVGRNLFKNGRLFIVGAFDNDEAMADAVNQLLLVGFYLVNLGFVALFLATGRTPDSLLKLIESTSSKIGIVSIVLGGMHYFNMFNFARIRKKSRRRLAESGSTQPLQEARIVQKLADNPTI